MAADLGLEVHRMACGGRLVKEDGRAACQRCGATFSADRMARAIASGQVAVDFGSMVRRKRGA